jgi:hypothetical protein
VKRYTHTPAHPDKVAGLNDAAILSGLSKRLDVAIDDMRTHTAQKSLIDARAVINTALRELTP